MLPNGACAQLTRRALWCAALVCVAVGAAAVSPLPAQPAPGALVQRSIRLDPSWPVSFDAAVSSSSVFVGEQLTYEMGIYIAEEARQRMRRNPEVVPAPLRGVLAFDLGTARTLPVMQQNGVRAVPYVLARALFPLTPGTLSIPASTMTYALPRSTSYFSREESVTLTTRALQVTVKPLPERGRPTTFTGAIGDVSVRLAIPRPSSRIGDPVRVVVSVSGAGNAKLWPRPALRVESGAAAPPVLSSERVRVDSSTRVLRGTHDFEWIITPTRAGPVQIAVDPYGYFNPERATYETATAAAAQLTVLPQGSVAATDTEPRPVGGDIDESRYTTVNTAPPWWRRTARGPLVALLVVVGAVYAGWRRRRRSGGARHTRPTGGPLELLIAALQRTQGSSDARTIRALLDVYLQDRLQQSVAVLADTAQLDGVLRRAGVSRSVAAQLCALRNQLDQAAWGPASQPLHASLRAELLRSLERIEEEALPREVLATPRTPGAAVPGLAPLSRSSAARLIP